MKKLYISRSARLIYFHISPSLDSTLGKSPRFRKVLEVASWQLIPTNANGDGSISLHALAKIRISAKNNIISSNNNESSVKGNRNKQNNNNNISSSNNKSSVTGNTNKQKNNNNDGSSCCEHKTTTNSRQYSSDKNGESCKQQELQEQQ